MKLSRLVSHCSNDASRKLIPCSSKFSYEKHLSSTSSSFSQPQGLKNLFSITRQSGSKRESFSRQSGSIAEISVAKSTNAEKCTTGVFLKWLFDWLAYLSQSGKLSSCKCRTLYEVANEKRYLMAFSGKYEIFKYSCSPGFQKYAIENLLKNLDLPQSYHRIVSVTPSQHEFLLALWDFPCLCNCCWRLISVFLRILFFEFLTDLVENWLNNDMIGRKGMVDSFNVSLSSSFIRKKSSSSWWSSNWAKRWNCLYHSCPTNHVFQFFFFFFDRTLAANACLCQCTGALSPLNPNWKRLMWMTDVPRKLIVTTRAIFPPPHEAQMVSKGESGREGT